MSPGLLAADVPSLSQQADWRWGEVLSPCQHPRANGKSRPSPRESEGPRLEDRPAPTHPAPWAPAQKVTHKDCPGWEPRSLWGPQGCQLSGPDLLLRVCRHRGAGRTRPSCSCALPTPPFCPTVFIKKSQTISGSRPFSHPSPSLLSFLHPLKTFLLFPPCCSKSRRNPDVRTSGFQTLSTA